MEIENNLETKFHVE